MNPILPSAVNAAMRGLCGSLRARVPGVVETVYVYGSVALGAYIEGPSDIDFIAVVKRPLSEADVAAIAEAHGDVERAWPGSDLMGSYIGRDDLGKNASELASFPAYFDRRLDPEGRHADLNPVTWWVLKKRGICVYGAGVPLDYEISTEALVRYVVGNMNSYWAGQIARLESRLASLGDDSEQTLSPGTLDEAVEWCVLGMLRQLYTIRRHDVTSKLGAGAYGLEAMPRRWHGLIREAMAIKRREPERVYRSQLARLRDLAELRRLHKRETNPTVGMQMRTYVL